MDIPMPMAAGPNDYLLGIIQPIVTAPLAWLTQLFNATSIGSFWVGCIFVFLVGRFILLPLFGSSLGSDKAKRKDNDNG